MAVDSLNRGDADPAAERAGPAVALERVVKTFGDVVAVDGIDLEIADGEFFSMLGPSGSGKTTTLRMIAGFEQPTEGSVLLHGRDMTGVPPFDRDVNTVFQDYALFPHMSVGDNVGYGLVVRQVRPTRAAERVARGDAHGPAGRLRGSKAGPALRRPASAGRAGPSAGQQARAFCCWTSRSAPWT